MSVGDLLDEAAREYRAGNRDQARELFTRVIEVEPGHPEALHLLGVIALRAGDAANAVDFIERALHTNPDMADARNNLAGALVAMGRHEDAAAQCEEALRLDPNSSNAWYYLGNIRQDQGRIDDALACYDHAVDADPQNARAHWNRALYWLQRGDFERGWDEYEWRWKNVDLNPDPVEYPRPLWDGTRLDGQTIFLYAEQGMGDAIQFVRYVQHVDARNARIILGCPAPLRRLFQGIWGADFVVTPPADLPNFVCHAPLMSLPRIFGTRLDSIPAPVPYIFPDEELVREWAPRLGDGGEFKVGLVWRGNPHHRNDHNRSIELSHLRRLLQVPGARFFSLQTDPTPAELGSPGAPIDLGSGVRDFADLAAAMNGLDLVISVDTAAAHLAGAIGRPTWLLLPHPADWRWLEDGDDSPWYPTMRLFRQRGGTGWDDVIARVGRALEERVRDHDPSEPCPMPALP